MIQQVGLLAAKIGERVKSNPVTWISGTMIAGLGLFVAGSFVAQQTLKLSIKPMSSTMIMANHSYINHDPFADIRQNSLAANAAKTLAPELSTSSLSGMLGRVDPFQPTVVPIDDQAALIPEKDPDILSNVEYVGLLDDKKPSQRIAMLRINNGSGKPYTAIKKVGERLSLDGHIITVRSLSGKTASLTVDGTSRQLTLHPHVDPTQQAKNNSAIAAATSGNASAPDPGDDEGSSVKSTLDKLSLPE